MTPRPLKLLEAVRASYWFIPGVMAVAALILGATLVYTDAVIGSGWLDKIAVYQSNKPAGAREVLATIAGSSITVAGTVFSVTIVAISFAAGQYGPRLLTNFMADRGNQVTLGTFAATFLYCLEVLRTIRGGEDSAFVPDLAVSIALVLAVASILVLIYFIHHVPSSIHVNTVVAHVGCSLLAGIEDRFPRHLGGAGGEPARTPAEAPAPLDSAAIGYVQSVSEEMLMEVASRRDLLVRMRSQPGDFVRPGRPIADVWPAERVDDATRAELLKAFAVGDRRSPAQDLNFLADELVEIATRALSAGVNDPTTAITCLEWLAAAAAKIGGRDEPDRCRVDKGGKLRVIAEPATFATFVSRVFGGLRQYVAGDANAAGRALSLLAELSHATSRPDQRRVLEHEAAALRAAATAKVDPSVATWPAG
jgi:uncharacterized membrane protein